MSTGNPPTIEQSFYKYFPGTICSSPFIPAPGHRPLGRRRLFYLLRRGNSSGVAGETHHYGRETRNPDGPGICQAYRKRSKTASRREKRQAHPPFRNTSPYRGVRQGERGEPIIREQTRIYGDNHRKQPGLPSLHISRKSTADSPTAAKTGKNED